VVTRSVTVALVVPSMAAVASMMADAAIGSVTASG
jgi:hypothetical protein